MRVLVGYASADGSTRGVAERIAASLAGRGATVDVEPILPALRFDSYDAIILGSAIHGGAWLPGAVEVIEKQLDVLGSRPLWLFSVSSIGQDSGAFPKLVRRAMLKALSLPKGIGPYWSQLRPRDHHWFAGVVTREQWGGSGDVFMKLFLGRYGDHRNRQEIDAWAEHIAAELTQRAGSMAR